MFFGSGSGGLGLDQDFGQLRLRGLAGGQALAQVGAEAMQGFDAGDDAGLFGEGWKRNPVLLQTSRSQIRLS